jgi:hypothetical protein
LKKSRIFGFMGGISTPPRGVGGVSGAEPGNKEQNQPKNLEIRENLWKSHGKHQAFTEQL